MALTFNGKVFRNLQEQVQYITLWLSANSLANEMGIKTLGRVDSEADLPANDPDHPFQYGDAYMVGEEGNTPYRMVIWSRDAGDGNSGWFDIGYFPTAPDQFSIVTVNGEPVHEWDADTKLDKVTTVTSSSQVYIKNADGTQTMLPLSASEAGGSIPLRASGGQVRVATTPSGDNDATSKKYVDDTFVLKQTTATGYPQVYAKATDGTQTMFNANTNPVSDAIPIRLAYGHIKLPNQTTYPPTDDDYAISKRYADAHYGSGLVHYLHSVKAVFELSNGSTYPVKISYINTTSTADTTWNAYGEPMLAVSAEDEGEDSQNTYFHFYVLPTTGTFYPYGTTGLGLVFHEIGQSDIYIGGLQDPEILSVSVVDTVTQL